MDVTRTVARNTIIQIVGRAISLIVALIIVRLLTGYLSQFGYGQYGFIVDWLGLFGILADFGLYLITIQRVTETHDHAERQKLINNLFTLRLITGLIMFSLGALLVQVMGYDPEIRRGIWIFALAQFLFLSSQIFVGIYQAYHRMEFAAIAEVAARLVLLATVGLVVSWDWGLYAVLWAYVASNAVWNVVAWLFSYKFLRPRLALDPAIWKKLLRQAAMVGSVVALSYVYFKGDTFFLSKMHLPHDQDNNVALGIYKAPYKLLEIIQMVPAIFMSALFPFLTDYIARRDGRLTEMLQKAFDTLVMMSFPILVGTLVLARQIIGLTTGGQGWDDSIIVLRILVLAVSVSFITNLINNAILAFKNYRPLLVRQIILVAINFALNIILIPRIGYFGSALATVFTEICVLGFGYLVLRQSIDFTPRLNNVLKVVLSSVAMGGGVYLLLQLGVWWLVTVPIGAAVYFGVLYVIGGVRREMLGT
jgi:O-antigen/teichoic acid export membrane protein